MSEQVLYIGSAVILTGLLFIVPKMVQLRIAVLKWLRFNWLADIHEKGFRPIVIAIRVMLILLIVFLLYLGLLA